MEKAEIRRIGYFLSDVFDGLCEGDGRLALELQLQELYRLIPTLMNATFKTKDKQLKTVLALLELQARKYKDEIEKQLAIKN
jgi:hypothetical protein